MATPTSRFFFIHVMKTAGTTFSRYLQRQFPPAEFYPSSGFDWELITDYEPYVSVPRLRVMPDARRDQVRMYSGHFPFMAAAVVAPGLRLLTLLRDPVDRTVSVLKHFKRLDDRFRTSTLDVIYEHPEISKAYVRNHQTKVFSFVPADQADTVLESLTVDDARLQLAKENLEHVEFVGLTEGFSEFVDELRTQLGWWPDGVDETVRANRSPEAWSVTPALRQRIADDNRHDVAFYRYAQELVSARRAAAATVSPRPER